jgi:hypothetical protein
MSRIQNNVFLGSARDSQNLQFIKKNNIRMVITVAQECENLPVDPSCTKTSYYVRSNTPGDLTSHVFNSTYDTIIAAQEQKMNVFVHCVNGMHRSAIVVLHYLMKKNNWTLEHAHAFLKKMRPVIDPPDCFMQLLQ